MGGKWKSTHSRGVERDAHKLQCWVLKAMEIADQAEAMMLPRQEGNYKELKAQIAKVDEVLVEPLAQKFRRLTRELMLDAEIQRKLRNRIQNELDGLFDGKTPVLSALIRVAAGPNKIISNGSGRRLPESPGWSGAPLLSIHLENLTDEQLAKFAEQGIRPTATNAQAPKQLPEPKPEK